MDFIRKNWSRLSLALLFLLGGILGIVAFANGGVFDGTGTQIFQTIVMMISVLVFFFGMATVCILKSLVGKKVVSITYIVMGALVSILNIAFLCVCVYNPNESQYISLVGAGAVYVFFSYLIPTLVFGFYPLIKGVTRFIEAEQTPVKAASQPAANAEEPKAPAAKKTAKTTAAK